MLLFVAIDVRIWHAPLPNKAPGSLYREVRGFFAKWSVYSAVSPYFRMLFASSRFVAGAAI